MGLTYPELDAVTYAFDGSIQVDKHDLMFLDTDDVKPASSQADQASEAANQRLFAKRFAGVSKERKLATQTAAGQTLDVMPDWVGEMPCASGTFEIGDMVGVDENGDGDALENQKLVKVTDPTAAIGYAVKRYASATTTVLVRLIARVTRYQPSKAVLGPLNGVGGANVETLAGNKTLTLADARVQVLDPGGSARDVTLPAEADSAGESFIVHNAADAAEVITIKDDGGGTVCTPTQGETAIVFCDGTAWRGIVGANA